MKTESQIEPEILEIVPLFLNSRKEDLRHLEDYLQNKNFDEIKKIAHTIKGISRPYGFPTLEDMSRQLETQALEKQPQEIQKTLHEMKTYLSKYIS